MSFWSKLRLFTHLHLYEETDDKKILTFVQMHKPSYYRGSVILFLDLYIHLLCDLFFIQELTYIINHTQ